MCGICGEIRFGGRSPAVEDVRTMTDAMATRGPDAAGLFAQNGAVLGHRRLKIIDITERAQQPMVDSALGLSVVYNGAIYNYGDLRRELEQKGYRFFSQGDTEVVLKAYHAWGERCVERFNGMFAFAIRERDAGRLFLARDRLGIKPLYYTETATSVRFASTLPALVQAGGVDSEIDPVALHYYLSFHAVIPAPWTILRGVRKLPPATTLTIDVDGTRRARTYWELRFERDREEARYGIDDWRRLVRAELTAAVARRLVADVPVGVLLSGGLDSSLIVGLLAEAGQPGLSTFSIGFESAGGEVGHEFEYSDVIAERFGTRHHRIEIDATRALPALRDAIGAMSEPMVSHDCVGFYLLGEEVAQHVRVVQSGQGADEVFAGYHWYPKLASSHDPASDYPAVFFDRGHEEYRHVVHPRFAGEDHSNHFMERHFAAAPATDPIDRVLHLDTTVMLVDDPVKRVDNMTMAWGLEARVPFLDHELVELAARIPAVHKLGAGGKHVLKEVARALLPRQVIDRPKGYFPVPALRHLRGEYLAWVRAVLHDPAARRRELFHPSYVDSLLADPDAQVTPLRGSKLWQVAVLEAWLQVQGL